MGYVALFLAMVLIAILLTLSGVGGQNTNHRAKKPDTTEVSKSDSMKRSDVRKRLLKLSEGKAPENLFMGAMCYEMALPPDRVEYTCPTCGAKTLYASGKEDKGARIYWRMGFFEWDLLACRRIVTQIKNLKITLVESQFCAKCSPDVENPVLVLLVHYDGEEEPHRVEDVALEDLQLLSEFLSGRKKHEGDFGVETPLKDHLERLEQLLGIEAETFDKRE
jgi:hypothetical protein